MTVRAEAVTEAGGRSAQLAELYLRRAPAAVGLAYLLVGDRSLAEDLAQEAFVRMAGRFQHLRAPEAVDLYLRRTVVNVCLSHLRRRRLEREYVAREGGLARVEASTPPDVALRQELWEALQLLPARQRAALVLRYYEDLPERQVADVMRSSIPAVRSLVARGIESLREQIRGEDDG